MALKQAVQAIQGGGVPNEPASKSSPADRQGAEPATVGEVPSEISKKLQDSYEAAGNPKTNEAGKIVIGPITPEGAVRLNAELKAAGVDLDVRGFRHAADAYAARHTFRKHGSEGTELRRGQLPITSKDWAKIPDILRSPDKIAYVGNQDRSRCDRILEANQWSRVVYRRNS